MKLSVIIVSYNVRHFLFECLASVDRAVAGTESEIFVIDNNSSDGSAEMVRKQFPHVRLISNKVNLGFSKANNQARNFATGEYILFLNPDTLVGEETFKVCTRFMDSKPGAGAMGVKMMDGKGNYLPESKRSIPTPMVAFYKITGLTSLFPRSKRFGRYYLSHLEDDKISEIEVLTGAFFFARKEALDKTGWFDEDFFMYGEDIDLSCRLLKKNYSIWYNPETSIIHYKGESTRRSSINYVLVFYRAMVVYTKKYFNLPGSFMLLLILHAAIYLRASLAILKRIISRLALPVFDAAVIYTGIPIILKFHERYFFQSNQMFTSGNQSVLIPVFIIIWIVSIYLSGGYKVPAANTRNIRGLLYGNLIILLIHVMLGADWHLKIAIILLLALWSILATSLTRILMSFFRTLSSRPYIPGH
ncbi:MAG: glycosyltransferase family 2 protein [Bacteroidales bacterium]